MEKKEIEQILLAQKWLAIKEITKNVYGGNHTTGYDVFDIILEAKRMGGKLSVTEGEVDRLNSHKAVKEIVYVVGANDEKQFPPIEPDPDAPWGEGDIPDWIFAICLVMREQHRLFLIENLNELFDMKTVKDIVKDVLRDTSFYRCVTNSITSAKTIIDETPQLQMEDYELFKEREVNQ
jgi:hypothetical protein